MSLLAATLLVLSPAAGEAAAPIAATQETNDPVICERQQVLGSRLRAKKVCMKKSEWAAQREQNRQLVERTQIQRGIAGGN